MEKGSVSMDASVIQDVWDWEVLPDEHRSFYAESRAASPHGHGGGGGGEVVLGETEEPIMPPPSEDTDADECKGIGVDVVVPGETRSTEERSMPAPATVTELLVSDNGEKEEETFKNSDAKEVDDDDKAPVAPEEEAAAAREFAGEEEESKKKERAAPAVAATKRPDCVVFSVGKLRVNGVGALCSFGVAAATVGVFLVGGRLQHQQKQQQQQQQHQKIQLQFLGDDKRMQQVVQQTSRLNQAMSSMMGAGASTRAKISFGGLYDGFYRTGSA